MTKTILVTDMPKACAYCNYLGIRNSNNENVCMLLDKGIKHFNDIDTERADICPFKPLGRKVEEYGLETWNTRDGIFLCEKGLFDELYGEE